VSAVLGYSALQLAVLGRIHYNFDARFTARTFRLLTYNRGMALAATLIGVGLIPNVALLTSWLADDLALGSISHSAVFGLTLIVLGFQTFAFTLLLHIVGRHHVDPPR